MKSLLWRNLRVKFGRTCIRDTGVPTAVIYGRWMAGELISTIASDYMFSAEHAVAAIYFELGRRERWSQEARELLEPDEPVEPPTLGEFEQKEGP